jgi:hypothetical protein
LLLQQTGAFLEEGEMLFFIELKGRIVEEGDN